MKLVAKLKGKLLATCHVTNSGFVVESGSLIRKSCTLKSNPGVPQKTLVLIEDGSLIDHDHEYYRLIRNIEFPSISTAARFVFQNDSNGKRWKHH